MESKSIRSINFTVENVGKVVKLTKKRYAWTLRVNGREYIVVYTRSSMSGKDRVLINGQNLYEKKEVFRPGLNLKLSFEGCIFSIIENDHGFKLFVDGKDFDELFGHERVKSILKKNKREEEQEQLSLSQLKERQMHPKSQSPPNEHNHENKKCMKKVHFNLEKNTVLIAPHLSYASDHGDSQVHPGQSAVQRMQTGFGHLDFPPLAPTQVLESSDIIFDGPPHIAPQMTGEPDYSDSRYGLGFGGQDRLPVNSSRFQQPPQPVLSHHQFALDPNSINRSLLNQNLFNSLLEETGNTQQPNSGHNRMPTEERGWHTDRPAQSNLFLPHFGGASRKQENQPIFQSRHTFEGDHLQYSNVPTEAKHRSQTTASPEFGSSLVSGQTLGSPAGQTNWQQTGGSYAPERLQSSGYHAAAIFNSTANPISPLKSGLNVKKPAPQTGIEQTALTAEDHRGTDQLPPTVDQHSYYYQPQDETSFSFYNGHTYSQQQPQRASTNLMTSMYSPSQTYPSQPIQQLDQPIYEPTSVSKTLFESQAEDLQILENGSYGQGWPSASSYQQQTANSSSHRYR